MDGQVAFTKRSHIKYQLALLLYWTWESNLEKYLPRCPSFNVFKSILESLLQSIRVQTTSPIPWLLSKLIILLKGS